MPGAPVSAEGRTPGNRAGDASYSEKRMPLRFARRVIIRTGIIFLAFVIALSLVLRFYGQRILLDRLVTAFDLFRFMIQPDSINKTASLPPSEPAETTEQTASPKPEEEQDEESE